MNSKIEEMMLVVRMIGGLGNQLFQYAFYLSLKKVNPKKKVRIWDQCYFSHIGYELESTFENLSLPKISWFYSFLWRAKKRLIGDTFTCSLSVDDPVSCIPALGMCFEGYWQRLQYVSLVEKELRRCLKFVPFEEDKNRTFSQYLERTSNTVALHVRRGDYLVFKEVFMLLGETSYYVNAIQYMCDQLVSPQFIVFSDDMAWCKESLPLPSDAQVHYVDWNKGKKAFRDMQLMSLCEHMIMANSTFSWWGAWLNENPNKIIVTPKQWFVSKSTQEVIDIPSSWVLL